MALLSAILYIIKSINGKMRRLRMIYPENTKNNPLKIQP